MFGTGSNGKSSRFGTNRVVLLDRQLDGFMQVMSAHSHTHST